MFEVDPKLALAGLLVGFMVGLTGMGGGALMTPLLVLGFGIDPTKAIGSDLVVSVLMKPFGAAVHHRAGTVRWEMIKWLVPFAIPAGFLGAFLLQFLGEGEVLQSRMKLAIGAALLIAVAGMIGRMLIGEVRNKTKPLPPNEKLEVRRLETALVGVFGGLIVGITSVGSGSLIIIAMMLLYPRLRANDLVGTDLIQAVPLVGAAAVGHMIFGEVSFDLTTSLLLGAIPGTIIGARASAKAPSSVLKWVLGVVLLASGLTLWGVPQPIVYAAGALLGFIGMDMTARRSRHPWAMKYAEIRHLKVRYTKK